MVKRPVDPAGGVENPGAVEAHLRVSHTSLDGHRLPTGSTGPAAVFLNRPLTSPRFEFQGGVKSPAQRQLRAAQVAKDPPGVDASPWRGILSMDRDVACPNERRTTTTGCVHPQRPFQ